MYILGFLPLPFKPGNLFTCGRCFSVLKSVLPFKPQEFGLEETTSVDTKTFNNPTLRLGPNQTPVLNSEGLWENSDLDGYFVALP